MLKSVCVALRLCAAMSGNAIVTDGDTIRVDGVAIRLWGLDCEELAEPHGRAAADAMREITNGATVKCELTGAKSYDRMVGTCYANGNDVAELMVRRGLCLDCARYSGGAYRKFEPADARTRLIQKPYCR